jgi:hypothetical protein
LLPYLLLAPSHGLRHLSHAADVPRLAAHLRGGGGDRRGAVVGDRLVRAAADGPAGMASFTLEPPGFHLHLWTPEAGLVTHTVNIGTFDGPHPFVLEADYPGSIAGARDQ